MRLVSISQYPGAKPRVTQLRLDLDNVLHVNFPNQFPLFLEAKDLHCAAVGRTSFCKFISSLVNVRLGVVFLHLVRLHARRVWSFAEKGSLAVMVCSATPAVVYLKVL